MDELIEKGEQYIVGAVAVTNRTEVTKITVACLLICNLSLYGVDTRSACGVRLVNR